MLRLVTILMSFLILANCGEAEQPAGVQQKVFLNGTIYTANDDQPTVEAVVVEDNRIVFAGSGEGARDTMGDNAVLIDLKGASMFPGFTDAHMHLRGVGERELRLNLEGTKSIEQLVAKVAAEVEQADAGDVIRGRGWIETHWPENRFPTRFDLDPISPDNPVILGRADGHALVANSAALERAGITAESEDPFGGVILKNEEGEPTGVLIDAAMGLMQPVLGAAPDQDQVVRFYEVGGAVYNRYGWTGAHNMSVNPGEVPIMEDLADNGKLPLRVYNSLDGKDPAIQKLFDEGPSVSKNGLITTRAIKLYIDGALGSRGALLLEPYSDADTSGLLQMEKAEIMNVLIPALENGIQVNTHAIGDKGNRLLLDWYAEAFEAVPPEERAIETPRWRDEHTQILHPDDIPRFAELGVIPSMQPSHAIGDLHFAPDRLGQERLVGAYAWKSLIETGVPIAGGSDAPVERGDPRIEFYAAVARMDLEGFSGEGWHPEEAASREEALKMFTIWPAYASFMEDELGTIEEGKLADFTIFSTDIMTIPVEDIPETQIMMTVVDGKIAYRHEEF